MINDKVEEILGFANIDTALKQNELAKKDLKNELFNAAEQAYNIIDDKFGKDIVVLNISNISVMADYFIIASAGSSSQLKAISDAVDQKLFELGIRLRHMEGTVNSGWVLLDFGSIIVHLFTKEQREFYNLERIWGDAEKLQIGN